MAETCFADYDFLRELGLEEYNNGCTDGNWIASGTDIDCLNPTTGKVIAKVKQGTVENYESCLAAAEAARKEWWSTPAPQRGEIVR
jgi:acyl-CoA reductase-like NAD-dependent aldehyde dehydrogenase